MSSPLDDYSELVTDPLEETIEETSDRIDPTSDLRLLSDSTVHKRDSVGAIAYPLSLVPGPPGTVIITFFTAQTLAQSDTARQTTVTCYPGRPLGPDDDPSSFAHPIIASVVGTSNTIGKVLDSRITELSYNMPDLEFDQHFTRALVLDFTRWLDNPNPNSRKLTPVPPHVSVVTLIASIVGHDGLLKSVSLPPLRLSFEPLGGVDDDSGKQESQSTIEAHSPSVPTAPFPIRLEKPTGKMPHYYVISTAGGKNCEIRDLTLDQMQSCAQAVHPRALKAETFNSTLGLAAALNAELLFSFATSATHEVKLRALDNLMEVGARYEELASRKTPTSRTRDGCGLAPPPMQFNEWYAANCVTVGIWQGIECTFRALELEYVFDKYFPMAFRMASRHYQLCAAIHRNPDSRFDERPAFGVADATFRFLSGITIYAEYCIVRYSFHDTVDDLDEAVRLYQEALRLPSLGPWYKQYISEKLAETLLTRFSDLRDQADLDDMVQAARECIAFLPENSASVAPYVTLGRALMHRGILFNGIDDILEAVEELRTATRNSDGGVETSIYLIDALVGLSTFMKDLDAANEAVNMARSALETAPESLAWYGTLVGLTSSALYQRFMLSRDSQHAAESLDMINKALEYDIYHRLRSDCYYAKSMLHHIPESPFCDDSISLTYLKQAVDNEAAFAERRLHYVNNWLTIPTKFGSLDPAAAKIYMDMVVAAIRLLPQLASYALESVSRLRALRNVSNIVVGAVTVAVLTMQPELALELVETGRSVFWNQALRLRTTIDDVPDDLRAVFMQCTQGLQETESGLSIKGLGAEDATHVRRRRFAKELDSVVNRIRCVPGLERFLLPQTPDMLKRAGDHGPVIVLSAAEDACIALIIRSGITFSVRMQVKRTQLEKWRAAWQDLVELTRRGRQGIEIGDEQFHNTALALSLADLSIEDPDSDSIERAARPVRKRQDPNSVYLFILENLWNFVVDSIIMALSLKGKTLDKPLRIWWCPTGPFVSLPLHAAGIYRPGGESCSDYIVSSYIPSLHALINARASSRPQLKADAKILLAAAPHPFEGPTIPDTIGEVQRIARLVSPEHILPLPYDEDVRQNPAGGITARTVLDQLSGASIFHLASHGQQVSDGPLKSGFLLRDKKLTIADLMHHPLPEAFLAFLSACETAKEVDTHPEESVHLAAAMLFAGFKSVIATMWSMDDVDGPEVAETVYRRLFGGESHLLDPDVIPYALADAAKALRDRGVSPGRWATYIHVGI